MWKLGYNTDCWVFNKDEYQEYQDLKDRGKTFQMICAGVHPQWKICDQKDKVLSNEKYCEYLDLKKWKADCDKDCEERDKGICLHKGGRYSNTSRMGEAMCSNCKKWFTWEQWHSFDDQETLEEDWDETSVIQDIQDELADLERDTSDLYEDNKILHDIMDDLRGDVLTLQKDLKEKADEFYTKSWYEDVWTEIDAISKTIGDKIHTQKLINKIVQEQINELERVHTDSNSGSDGEKTLPKQVNKGTARKVKVRVEKSS